MAYGLWNVSGKVIIPGTRKSATFGPVRIGDKDRQTASKWIGHMLNEKFKRELRGDHKFSPHFALMNLQWENIGKSAAAPPAEVAVAAMASVQSNEAAQ